MFFQRKRSKKTKAKLRRARTRRIIDSLTPISPRIESRLGKEAISNQQVLLSEIKRVDTHQDLIRKALIHILEKELE